MERAQKQFDLPSLRVLVVEDEYLLRIAMADFLREFGLIVIEATSGEEARSAVIAGTRVDLLFSDIQLADALDGVALARQLRELQPGLPVILTSGDVVPPDDIPDVPFVQKPYSYHKVADLILQSLKLDAVHHGP